MRFKAVIQKRGVHRDGQDRLAIEIKKELVSKLYAGQEVLVRTVKEKPERKEKEEAKEEDVNVRGLQELFD